MEPHVNNLWITIIALVLTVTKEQIVKKVLGFKVLNYSFPVTLYLFYLIIQISIEGPWKELLAIPDIPQNLKK